MNNLVSPGGVEISRIEVVETPAPHACLTPRGRHRVSLFRRHPLARWVCGLGIVAFLVIAAMGADVLERGFEQPPPETRPWVYWFWLNGNITSNGITADLEAMQRVGIGGVLIMEVDQGIPVGPVDFMGKSWRALFQHVVAEARRLGLSVNMNNDAGWNGSGGPWIRPEQSMQKVVWSETNIAGGGRFEGTLAQPETVAGFYRDIAVMAVPTPGSYRIASIRAKALYETAYVGGIARDKLPAEMVIERNRIVTLTPKMDRAGRLAWDVPAGQWTILRFGHTSTGLENAPAPKTGRGLECDKLSREGIEANFTGMMEHLAADNRVKPGRSQLGLIATHIDSWENGAQNWTARMLEEFRKRRGYDLLTFLPVITGRVVDSLEVSERFLWDLRQTVSELVVENYAGRMRELAKANGLRFTVEAYGGPCDNLPYGGRADEPMGEFWSPSGAMETCKGMASCGHVYGKPIVGAESFTAGNQERWREYPASLKALGDHAFCEGINRFVFHRFALQPWPEERLPGMTMGPWGQHYERTETWWDQTPAWHDYLARCQFLLRQGRFVADICYLQSETPPQGFGDHPRRGYDWDECPAEVVLTRMTVKDHRLSLPDGLSYRVLVLPQTETMTPRLLRKIKQLAEDGATIIGAPPKYSPSLSGYPQCDEEVRTLAAQIWGTCDGAKVTERSLGQGSVVWRAEPEKVLLRAGVLPDFASDEPLGHIHRIVGDTDQYFVANPTPRRVATTASFRVTGRVPELWWPESGRRERARLYEPQAGLTSVALMLEPSGSVFVVFRAKLVKEEPVVSVSLDGKVLVSARPSPRPHVQVVKAIYGVPNDPPRTRDVREKVQALVDAGEDSFQVAHLADGDDPAPNMLKTLTVDYTIGTTVHSVKAQDPFVIHLTPETLNVKVEKARYGVLSDPLRTRDVRAKVQRLVDAGESSFTVARMAEGDDPAVLVVKTLELEYTRNGEHVSTQGTDPDTIDLKAPVFEQAPRVVELRNDATGHPHLLAFQPGLYHLVTSTSKQREYKVGSLPTPIEIGGPWQVHFSPDLGAPPSVAFESLVSWTARPETGVKYFSGAATYTKTFVLPREFLARGRRVFLDLGRVEVMAQLKLNGKDLGTLWKPPFRIEITGAARHGENNLEVRAVNLWPNRLIGDEQLPEDSDRNPDGSLRSWPGWLAEGKRSPAGRIAFTTWRLWKRTDALLESGLLGPVTVTSASEIDL
ncbi:putative Glycoside hydrolase (GH2) [Verrucomicrobia bacterium]|nr:putative Glycoside hydrolase (GH2) [Verrucomicrobiota bacterium]